MAPTTGPGRTAARPPRRLPRLTLLLLMAGWLVASPARAEVARVVEVVDGDTVVLASGDQVRLVGIQAPKLPLGRPGFVAWPLAAEARAALARLVLDREVRLAFDGRRVDRHGRLLAHLEDSAGLWIQGELVALGMARVYSFADNRARTPELLLLERQARAAGRGIWGDSPALRAFYAVRDAPETPQFIDTFQLVEGRVLAVATVRNRTYLNFGADWQSDFTVTFDRAAGRLFAEAGLAPESLEGRRIRTRGWIDERNGPVIEVSHPELIELLEP